MDMKWVNPFQPTFRFYTFWKFWKYQKFYNLLMFLEGIEREKYPEMD